MLQPSDNEQKYREQEQKSDKQMSDKTEEQPSYYQKQRKFIYYIINWFMFFFACGIYFSIWAIDRHVTKIQQSYYYASSKYMSPYIFSQNTQQTSCDFAVDKNTDASTIFSSDQRNNAVSIVLPLIYNWIMWKLPLMVFTLDIIWIQKNKVIRFVPWLACLIILGVFDALLFIFLPQSYHDWYFYAMYSGLSIILVLINTCKKRLVGLAALLIPLFFVALIYTCYSYFFPALYYVYALNLPQASSFLQIYLFPLWDLSIYVIYLLINAYIPKLATKFLSYVNFLLLGYFVGMTILVGITEVEFYYLLAYLLFRNFFVNWVMWKWDHIVNMNAVLPGWILPYYLSFMLNYIPMTGIGQLTTGASYFTAQFSQACLLLYYIPSSLYFYNNPSNVSMGTQINWDLIGYIYWPGAIIIWGISTFSQRYPLMKPSGFDFFYMLIGLYMFYIGLNAAMQIIPLSNVAMKMDK